MLSISTNLAAVEEAGCNRWFIVIGAAWGSYPVAWGAVWSDVQPVVVLISTLSLHLYLAQSLLSKADCPDPSVDKKYQKYKSVELGDH